MSDAWSVFGPLEVRECEAIADAVTAWLKRHMETVVVEHVDRPILFCYMCDGWGSFVGRRTTRRQGEMVVQHYGRHREEYLLQRSVLRTLSPSASGHQLMNLISPPRPLRLGRGSWNIFVAAGEFFGTLRSLGHRGISVTVYLQDGALDESSLRKFRGKHEVWYDNDICPVDAGDRDSATPTRFSACNVSHTRAQTR